MLSNTAGSQNPPLVASCPAPQRQILYCNFRILSILSQCASNGWRLLANTYKTHPILYFAYVGHTFLNTVWTADTSSPASPSRILYCIFLMLSILFQWCCKSGSKLAQISIPSDIDNYIAFYIRLAHFCFFLPRGADECGVSAPGECGVSAPPS